MTPAQRVTLRERNATLRRQVVETVTHPRSGESVHLGLSPTQRAAALGLARATVQLWDRAGSRNGGPTHFRDAAGEIRPLHPGRPHLDERECRCRPCAALSTAIDARLGSDAVRRAGRAVDVVHGLLGADGDDGETGGADGK